jgi:RimJ/RimL family protein N-acetyltransferase
MTTRSDTLTLPRDVKLSDGGEITLRMLTMADFDAFFAFTSSLPPHDMLFLRTDITDATVLAGWLENIELGRILTIVAEREDKVHGYGSLHFSNAPWSQHVGELRVLVDGAMRGKGLGRALTEAVFAQALQRGIEKIMAQMTVDQKGAIATFEELGFKPEALLVDHVKDREGRKHDLLVYSHDVNGFHAQMAAYGVSDVTAGGG